MYAVTSHFAGNQPIDLYTPSTSQLHPLGMEIAAIDPNFFGGGKFVYGIAAAAMTSIGRLNFMTYQYAATDIPNTANTGFGICANTAVMAISTYGWFQVSGLIPVQTAASVAIAAAVGIGAAGQAGTNSAGKQILGARVVQPSTYAPTYTAFTRNGSPIVDVSNSAGLVPGLTVTGTGISGTIVSIDPSQRTIKLSANATATGAITLTATWTNFLLLWVPSGAFVQGAIT